MSVLSKSFANKIRKTFKEEFSLEEILARGITKEELICVMVNANGDRTSLNNSAYYIDMASKNGGFVSFNMAANGIDELKNIKDLNWSSINTIHVYEG